MNKQQQVLYTLDQTMSVLFKFIIITMEKNYCKQDTETA